MLHQEEDLTKQAQGGDGWRNASGAKVFHEGIHHKNQTVADTSFPYHRQTRISQNISQYWSKDTYPWGKTLRKKVPWSRGSFKQIHNHTWSPWLWDLYDLPNALVRHIADQWNCGDTLKKEKGQPSLKVHQVWSSGVSETRDRILDQLSLLVSDIQPYDTEVNRTLSGNKPNTQPVLKKILVFATGRQRPPEGQNEFLTCPINTCTLVTNESLVESMDALLFVRRTPPIGIPRNPNQIWIMHHLESPTHSGNYKHNKDNINWTATYRYRMPSILHIFLFIIFYHYYYHFL